MKTFKGDMKGYLEDGNDYKLFYVHYDEIMEFCRMNKLASYMDEWFTKDTRVTYLSIMLGITIVPLGLYMSTSDSNRNRAYANAKNGCYQ